MMRALHKLVGILLLIAVLAGTGWLFFHAAKSSSGWQSFLAEYASERFAVGCISAAVFLLGVLYVLTGMRHREADRYLTFSGDGGTVSVSLRGMGSFISKLADEFDSVKDMTARIVPGSGTIDIVLDTRIRDGVQIHEVCELLQQRVRGALKESLGITDIRNVKVNVREIVAGR